MRDRGVERKSDVFQGKVFALGICGSIGAVEIVKIIRELRRHGARVKGFLTPSTTQFITETSIEWALDEKPVNALTSELDHLEPYDAVIVIPATWNTIAKCAVGIADNPVTLLVASQLGRRGKVLFVPAMNSLLQNHPLYGEHSAKLKQLGAEVWEPNFEEGRLKTPSPETVVSHLVEWLG
jgi:phosphopantothenoylcysteine decarboxylase / phosphopantothenate---cysteine ligase